MGDDPFIKLESGSGVQKHSADWTLRFFVLLAAVFVVRAMFIVLVPFGLVGDEAYYWDWGRRLAWGYFSKPPLIAWLMALAGWTGGDTAFGLRIWAAILGSGSAAFAFLLARRLYGDKTAFWAGLMLLAMPGAVLLNLFLTIDAPLLFFWCAALYLTHLFLDSRISGWRRAGVALGLLLVLGLGHLSKQIMWAFPALCIVYLLSGGAEGRSRLRSPLLWVTLLGSYLFLVPTLLWNAENGWITFKHTGHHFQGSGIADFPKHFGEFAGMQLGALSPILCVLIYWLSIGGLLRLRRICEADRYLVIFSGIPLAFVLLMTLRQGMNGNWAAAFYPAGLILLAGWAGRNGDCSLPLSHKVKAWVRPGVWLAVAMSILVYALPAITHFAGLEGSKRDAFARMRGWEDFAAEVHKLRQDMPRKDAPILVSGHRYNVSQLAFYLPDQPRVYHWVKPGNIDSQYQIWGGLEELRGREILILSVDNEGRLPAELREHLAWSRPAGIISHDVGNGRLLKASLYWASYIGEPGGVRGAGR